MHGKMQAFVHGYSPVVIGTHMQKRHLPGAYNQAYLVLHQCGGIALAQVMGVGANGTDLRVLLHMQALPGHGYQLSITKNPMVVPKLDGARPKGSGFGEPGQLYHLGHMLRS